MGTLYLRVFRQGVDTHCGLQAWSITGDITPAEWARFRTFATRVRELSYQPYDSFCLIDPLVWTILARKCRGDPLFPRLRLLDYPGIGCEDIGPIISFLSPSLRSVSFRFISPEDVAAPLFAGMKILFQTLVDIAPDLTELDWNAPPDILPLEEASFMAEISRLRHLRGLTLTKPGFEVDQAPVAAAASLQAIIAVRTLRTLVLDVDHVDVHNTTKVADGNPTLENLRTLDLMGGPGEKLASLVHSLCLPALENLVVDTFDSQRVMVLTPL